jgi:hypothetical protein
MYSRVYNNNNKKPILFEIYITYIYICAHVYIIIYMHVLKISLQNNKLVCAYICTDSTLIIIILFICPKLNKKYPIAFVFLSLCKN